MRVCGVCSAKPLTAIGRLVDNLLVYTLDVDAHLKLKEMSVNSIVFTDATGLESKSEYISYYGKGWNKLTIKKLKIVHSILRCVLC